jgi:hypothetical protein
VLLKCSRPFGNFNPGDEVEVPDGAEFDHAHFECAEQPELKEEKPDAN